MVASSRCIYSCVGNPEASVRKVREGGVLPVLQRGGAVREFCSKEALQP